MFRTNDYERANERLNEHFQNNSGRRLNIHMNIHMKRAVLNLRIAILTLFHVYLRERSPWKPYRELLSFDGWILENMISSEMLKGLGVEWVRPSEGGNRPGYFRKIARTRRDPSVRQLEHRLKFAETAYGTFGERGVIITSDDRQISKNAGIIGKKLMGTARPKDVLSQREKLIRLILNE